MQKESKLYLGDCLDVLPTLEADSIDAVVTDPPYFLMNDSGVGFMGNEWDSLYTSKINSILYKSKEFANFVVRFFALTQVDSNMEEGNFVQSNVNTEGCQKRTEKTLNVHVPSVEKSSSDTPTRLKVNISSVRGLVLTKVEVLDLLNINHIKNAPPFKNLNEDALFVVPISYIIKSLKNTVAGSALKSSTKNVCVEPGILLTSMEEAKIKSVIEAITGMKSEKSVMPEIDTNVDTVGSTAEEKKYTHIILSHTEKEEVANYLISLLYALFVMPELNKSPNSSFNEIRKRDLIYRFHKNWAIEALRVLKPGAFAFVMSSPRSDLLPLMITALRDAGFNTGFSSIYWTYATGFPKAQNISKVLNKRAGDKQTIIGHYQAPDGANRKYSTHANNSKTVYNIDMETYQKEERRIRAPVTEDAKKFAGAYSGFQPKPAVEIVIVAMKPIEERTFLDQALANGHGCTWLDNCRIPTREKNQIQGHYCDISQVPNRTAIKKYPKELGRVPANVLCEDNVLDDGRITKSTGGNTKRGKTIFSEPKDDSKYFHYEDSGDFSRYFSLDAWFAERIKLLPKEAQRTFPWLIVPKASITEKKLNIAVNPTDNSDAYNGKFPDSKADKKNENKHPTMKPLKLMIWLITLSSREGGIILDPFMGSGTTPLAAKMIHRQYKGIELKEEFFNTAVKRVDEAQQSMDRFL